MRSIENFMCGKFIMRLNIIVHVCNTCKNCKTVKKLTELNETF